MCKFIGDSRDTSYYTFQVLHRHPARLPVAPPPVLGVQRAALQPRGAQLPHLQSRPSRHRRVRSLSLLTMMTDEMTFGRATAVQGSA